METIGRITSLILYSIGNTSRNEPKSSNMKYYLKTITKMATIFTFCCVIEILTEDTAAADKEIRMGRQRNTSGEVSSSTLNILIIF